MPRSQRWICASMMGPETSPAMLKTSPLSLNWQAAAVASALSCCRYNLSCRGADATLRGDRRCDIFLTSARTHPTDDGHVDLPRWTGNVLVKLITAGRCRGCDAPGPIGLSVAARDRQASFAKGEL